MPTLPSPDQTSLFLDGFSILAAYVHKCCEVNGFWEAGANRNKGEMLALMHSELSEGLEALRKNLDSDHIPPYKGIEEELADCIIRIMDFAAGFNLSVEGALVAKLQFNSTRPFRHGKQF